MSLETKRRGRRPTTSRRRSSAFDAKGGGLRLDLRQSSSEVRLAVIRFARWLRRFHSFPRRVTLRLESSKTLRTIDGREVTASFFAPDVATWVPLMRVAVGDYRELKSRRGRDNALAAIIVSISHEVIHYQQWVSTGSFTERNVRRDALRMLRAYERTVDHP